MFRKMNGQYQVYQLWGKMVEKYQHFLVFRGVRGGRPKNLQSTFHHFGLSHDTGHVDCFVSPGTFSLAGCYDVNLPGISEHLSVSTQLV